MYTFSLITKENIYSIIPLLQILDKNTSELLLISRLDEMLLQGYECVGIYEKNKLSKIKSI